ncbi:hypothetical protein FHG87_005402 [Trinorchestia longiramus]|nr:hypothetical protein FHG87_005402 [Trinorchestia longiramus]
MSDSAKSHKAIHNSVMSESCKFTKQYVIALDENAVELSCVLDAPRDPPTLQTSLISHTSTRPLNDAFFNDLHSFRHGEDIEFISPVELKDFFPREENEVFISPHVEEDFVFPEVHAEFFNSDENEDLSLSRTQDQHVVFDDKEFPTIYYPDSDFSAGNTIAPDYHVKEYPNNYREVKEYPDPKHPEGDHGTETDQGKDHQKGVFAAPTKPVNFAADEPSTNPHLQNTKLPESQKVTTNFFGSEKGIPGVQDFPKPDGVAVSGKSRPRRGKSVPRRAVGIKRQFDSSDFSDYDYSSSSGSSDPFEGNYDGDYYAPGDDDSTVHVGNDAAYDYDYSNSHGPDLFSDHSSFTHDFARSRGILGSTRSPQKKK